MYSIRDGLIYYDGQLVAQKPTPNRGGRMRPRLVVMHFTADHLYPQDGLGWLTDKNSKASAHVHIDRKGSLVQLAPLDVITWHAGKSSWRGQPRVNGFGIGIELDNPGQLARMGDKVRAWFGDSYPKEQALYVPAGPQPGWWMPYTERQKQAAYDLLTAIGRDMGVAEVVGHSDVSPGRKNDPGPLLDMEKCRAALRHGVGPGAAPTDTMRAATLTAQEHLNDLGYSAGEEDGDHGPKTAGAVAAFQAENGLTVTGQLDKPTSAVLASPQAKAMPVGAKSLKTSAELMSESRTMQTANRVDWLGTLTALSGFGVTLSSALTDLKAALGPNGVTILLVVGGLGAAAIGLFNVYDARRIKGFRLEDSQTGRHVG